MPATEPRKEPMQADAVRTLIQEASAQLVEARTQYEKTPRDFHAMARHSLSALETSLRAYLTWHAVPLGAEATVRELGERSRHLNNVFRLTSDLAPAFAEKVASLSDDGDLPIEMRQQLDRGYHVARTAYRLLLQNMPAAVIPQDAVRDA